MYRTTLLLLASLLLVAHEAGSQQISKDELIYLTPEWEGER